MTALSPSQVSARMAPDIFGTDWARQPFSPSTRPLLWARRCARGATRISPVNLTIRGWQARQPCGRGAEAEARRREVTCSK